MWCTMEPQKKATRNAFNRLSNRKCIKFYTLPIGIMIQNSMVECLCKKGPS